MENDTSAVERESDFLHFVRIANPKQSTFLLRNLTPSQTNAISEICYNILYSEDLEKKLIEALKRHRNLIRTLGDRNSSVNVRRRAVAEHPRIVLKILQRVESALPI